MARVAAEPTPTPARAFLRSLRVLAPRDALAALATAWRLAFEPTGSVTASARAASASLLLAVIVFVGIGGPLAASGLSAILGGPDGPTPQQLDVGAPTESPTVSATPSPTPSPQPSPSLTPSPSPEATPSPEPSSTPAAVKKPTPNASTPRPKATQRSDDGRDVRDREDREDEESAKGDERKRSDDAERDMDDD
jgi:hypothetical protein